MSEFIGRFSNDFNEKQYTKYANEYIAANLDGSRGGRTPAERLAILQEYLSPGRRVFCIGSGAAKDELELAQIYEVTASDFVWPFIEHQRKLGLRVTHFDARKDRIPRGPDAVFSHMALHHVAPFDRARVYESAREVLPPDGVVMVNMIEGKGHEKSKRTGSFERVWFKADLSREKQILFQEGFEVVRDDKVTANNGTKTLHLVAIPRKDYEGNSFSKQGLQPHGDVFWGVDCVYNGDVIYDLVAAQAEEGLIEPNGRPLRALADVMLRHKRRLITDEEFIKEANFVWIQSLVKNTKEEALTDRLMNHAQEFLRKNLKLRRSVAPAFAIANNNGFGNILIGLYPSWLVAVIARNLGADGFITASGFRKSSENLSEDIHDLDKMGFNKGVTRKQALGLRQKEVEDYLASDSKRVTIGVGSSLNDKSFLSVTDYPVIISNNPHVEIEVHQNWGYFDDEAGLSLAVEDAAVPRWTVVYDDQHLALMLNVFTSGRDPVDHNTKNHKSRLWTTRRNKVNLDYYAQGDNPLMAIVCDEDGEVV